jgi:hypothetical protein
METLLGILGYFIVVVIGILIAGIPIIIAVIVRSVTRVNIKVTCPKCSEKVRPRKTGRQRVAGIKGEIAEQHQCPSCGHTWWKLA